jgi:hypothetical protein
MSLFLSYQLVAIDFSSYVENLSRRQILTLGAITANLIMLQHDQLSCECPLYSFSFMNFLSSPKNENKILKATLIWYNSCGRAKERIFRFVLPEK